MSKVSVIIPTYNRGDKLQRAIDSVLNQTYTNLEIIVIDDGSTDNTPEIVQKYDDNQIKYIYCCENRGANHARNIGVRNSNGKYISFLDSDDVLRKKYHEITINALENSNSDCVGAFVSYNVYNNGFEGTHNIKKEVVKQDDLAHKNIIGGFSCTVFKSDIFDKIGGLDENLDASQDYDFYLRVLKDHKMIGIDKVLLDHYIQSDSISKNIQAKSSANNLILQKHDSVISNKRKSSQLFTEGILHGLNGNMSVSKRKLWSAIKIRPTKVVYYYFLALSITNKEIFTTFYNFAKKIRKAMYSATSVFN